MQVAAGPGFVVQMVNLAARIWTTSAGAPSQELQTVGLASLFDVAAGDRLTDPRVVYDAASSRWFASISDIDTSSVVLAVSPGPDPTGSWHTYSFAASGCADQPRLGLADGVVVLAADVFSSCDNGFAPLLGGELWVANKAQLVAGAAQVASTSFGPESALQSLAPVQSLSSTATEYAVSVDSPGSRVVHLFAIDGIPPAAVQVQSVAAPAVSPLSTPPLGAEPATGVGGRQPTIGTNDDRVLDSVWENGKLWLSANTGCVPSGDAELRACGRVIELATATSTVDWDTNLSVPGADVFYPAISPDGSGNLVVIYGESSAAILPQLVAVARTPAGTFTTPVVIARSAGPYTARRFGDYFGAARDPSRPELVWVAGEQGLALAGTHSWSTTVASLEMNAVGVPQPPALSGAAPPRLRAQVVAARAGARVRLSYKVLDDGAGVREKVIVSGKKSVLFGTTTAKGRLHADQVYFVLWHPAKKLRGRFTWCVEAIGSDAQRSAPSCSTVTLR
ncbi:MAG TPA: hypothetical protein VMU58_10445 [Gaiellaceae bacterium]|nr:hypothetical protein [Gaiellaceae bacterium]